MFPLIEALSTIPGANYDKLCSQTLDIVIKTIATLPPLALSKEPSDCLSAFKDFISRQIESNKFGVESPAKGQALVALLSLVISQGRGQHVFELLDILFKVHEASQRGAAESALPVGAAVRNLVEHSRDSDVPLPLEPLEDAWTVDLLLNKSRSSLSLSQNPSSSYAFVSESLAGSSLASDGKFLYMHSPHGLLKLGSGLYNTIRGHLYASNPNFRTSDRWSSLVCVGEKLYYWSPELSYETFRPSKPKSSSESSPSPAPQSPVPAAAEASPAPSSQPLPRICHVIAVLSTDDLHQLSTIRTEDCSLSMQSRMITDGKYLMFVGKQRGKGAKSTLQQQQLLQQQQMQQQQQQMMQLQLQQQQQQQQNMFGGFASLSQPRAFSLDLGPNDILNSLASNPHGALRNDELPGFSFPPRPVAVDEWPGSSIAVPEANLENLLHLRAEAVEEEPVSESSDEEESEVDDQDQDNEDDEADGSDEDLYNEGEQYEAPVRRRRDISASNGSRSRNREEDDAVSNVIAVEWFDISGSIKPPTTLSESAALVPELADIGVIIPVRSLELPSRTMTTNAGFGSQQEIELFPSSFGQSAFLTNGHHLVVVSKNMPYRSFSLVDGKPLPENSSPTMLHRSLDARDCFSYDSSSNVIWVYRSDNSRCTRFHNMGLVPHYGAEDTSAMQVDVPLSASTASNKVSYSLPQAPPLSPEAMLHQLDVWTPNTKKTRLAGVSKTVYIAAERTLKDNLTPIECISVITASLDRLARHHWAYSSHAAVDESHASTSTLDLSFAITASIETLQAIFSNLEHALRLARSASSSSLEQAGSLLLSFLRVLKVNLHFFSTSGQANTITDEHRTLFANLRALLLNLTGTEGVSDPEFGTPAFGTPRLDSLIQKEACDALCVGFVIFYPQPRVQIEFLKMLTEKSKSVSLLHDKLACTLASFYRIHEMLVDDSKPSAMDVDAPESSPAMKHKRTVSLSGSNQQLSASAQVTKDKSADIRLNFGRELPFQPQAPALLSALVRKSLSGTYDKLERIFAVSSTTELANAKLDHLAIGSSQRLLLALQMEIVSLTFAKGLVIQYFEAVAKIVEEFLQTIKKFRLNEPSILQGLSVASDDSTLDSESYLRRSQWKAAHTVLQSSVVGTLLPSLLSALARKNHARDPSFVIHAFDGLCNLLQALDTFNSDLSMLAHVDQIQLVRAAQSTRGSSFEDPRDLPSSVTWLLDLQSTVAAISRKCVVTMLEGEPASDKEKQCQDWLDTRLLNGGIDENLKNMEKVKWLEAFAEGKEAPQLYTWIKSQGGPRPQARPSAKISLERAERYALAAMMKHAGLIDDAQVFAKTIAEGASLSGSHVGRFSFIAKKATAFSSILTRRAEMQKTWQLAVQDKVNDFDVFREMVQRPERLYEFCEMRGVEANPVNSEETIKRLMKKLQEEIAASESLKKSGSTPSADIFEALCAPVVERASFLLKLLPSNRTVRHPSVDSTNPYASGKAEAQRLRASAPGSKEGGARGHLTKSMSLLPATESAQEKIRQRKFEQEDNDSFSQRVDELRSWLQAYSDWEQTVLLHNRTKRDEPPPSSPIQGVVAFTTNQSITVKDWERVLRVQATRAKSREQGLIYLNRLLSTCHFAAPRQQLLGPLNVTHYLDGIQSSGQAATERVTELFSELFLSLTNLVRDTNLDSSSRLLALNICAIAYTEHEAELLQNADAFQLLHQVMAEPTPDTHHLGPEAATAMKLTHRALHGAAWTCFRLFAVQVVSWRHHDDLMADRATTTKLQHQAFDVYLMQLKSFAADMVTHDLRDWEREVLAIEPHAGRDFAFELVFLLRLLSETSKAWAGGDAVPTLLKFLSSRTAPRAQRVVLRLLRKLLPTAAATKEMVQFCLTEMGKWIFQGKCNTDSAKPRAVVDKPAEETSKAADYAPKEKQSDTYSVTAISPIDTLDQILSSGTVDASFAELLKQAYAPLVPGRTPGKESKTLPQADALRLASLRAKFGDILQVTHESNASGSDGASKKNDAIAALNPVFWADGGAASMLASEYIALLRFLSSPNTQSWQSIVRESVETSISSLPELVAKLAQNPASLAESDAKALFSALSALCLLSGFSEPVRVGCKVVVNAPVVSQAELVTGTVVAYNSFGLSADVVLDSEAHDHQAVHTFDVKLLQAIAEVELDEANIAPLAPIIPLLLSVVNTPSSLDTIVLPVAKRQGAAEAEESEKSQNTATMDVDEVSASQEVPASPAPALDEKPLHESHYQNAWLFQELKSKALCALDLLLQHADGSKFMLSECSDSIPALLSLAQRADSTSYMEKIERQLNNISARLWNIQTIPAGLDGRSRRNNKSESCSMNGTLPHFWNSGKANALPTGLDKASLSLGTVILDEEACTIQLHPTRNQGHGSFGRPSRGGLSRYGGKSEQSDISFMFGNCVVPSKGLGQYYFELQIHPEGSVEKPSGGSSKPHVSIGLVPDPQSSGPASVSSSSYRSSYRSGDMSTPFPPGCYCYMSTRSKAWVSDNNVKTEGYGEHFTYGAVVGCLWDQNERTITFTKNGEELDVAFRNVLSGEGQSSNDRLVPCISASRGVQLTLNFGQTPFKFSPALDNELDAAAREAKRKEAEEKRQKAIQEEQAQRKAEQEQREAAFNEDASSLLGMGFCARHCLRAMMHAGWSYKNRWTNQEGVMMAANWLMEASPDQLGPAGDLPSETASAPAEEPPKPPQSTTPPPKKKSAKADKSSGKDAAVEATPQKFQKPLNPENDYPTSKSSEYILGDAYSLGAPRKAGITQATIWRRDILPLVTSDIPFPSNDPTLNQLIAYAEAGNEDALKSNLADLYHGKIPAHIRLPSQLKIVESEVVQLKMTQVTPDMTVQVASAESSSRLARFVGKSGLVLDRDPKRNLVLLQFVSSEDGSLEEWWFPVHSLVKDRTASRPFADIEDPAALQLLLASRTQQHSFFAARRVLLSLLRHAPLAFDVSRAKRDLEELARAALPEDALMSVDAQPSESESVAPAAAQLGKSLGDAQTVSGAIDVQDAIQLISREYLSAPETLVSSQSLFSTADYDDGMNFAGAKLVELLTRVYEQQGNDACGHLLNGMMQKCIGLLDVASHFTNSKTVSFSHNDANAANQVPAPLTSSSKSKSSKSSSSSSAQPAAPAAAAAAPAGLVVSQANHVHKVHVPGARACILIIHAETPSSTRLNVYLDEDLTDAVNSIGGSSELEGSVYSSGGPFQPVLVPTNTFWVSARGSSQPNLFGIADGGRANLEYRATVVPVSSDFALGRWIAEFLAFSVTNGPLHVPLDFMPLINTLLDFLYVTHVPTILKESVMALFARIVHELRRRSRGQAHKLCQLVDPIGQPLDLSRTMMLKKEMIALYDNERRSAGNTDNSSVKKRGAPFTTYLHSLIELMISVRLYDIEKTARQKIASDRSPGHAFASGSPDETMQAALALVQSFETPKTPALSKDEELSETFALFSEEDMPSGPMKIPAEGEEDSSTTDSDAPGPDWEAEAEADANGDSPLANLFASTGIEKPAAAAASEKPSEEVPKSESPAAPVADASLPDLQDASNVEEIPEDIDVAAQWGGYGDMGDMDMDDDLAAAIALSMREQEDSESEKSEKSEKAEEKPIEKKEESPEKKKEEESEKKDEEPKASPKGSPKRAASPSAAAIIPAPPAPPAAAAMDVDKPSGIPPPPKPPSGMVGSVEARNAIAALFGSPHTPELRRAPSKRPAPVQAVSDPSWFATLVAAAQALENFAEQARSGSIPPVSVEAESSLESSKANAEASTTSNASSAPSSEMQVDVPIATEVSKVDSIALQFTKEAIRTAWANTRSDDFVRPRLFLLENLPNVDAEKRAELATALEELVEEKGLVVDLYLPVDLEKKVTKNWMIVEVQSPDNIPSVVTFKDPNFTANQPIKINVVPVRRLLEKTRAPVSSAPATPSVEPISAATASETQTKKIDLHFDEPEASLEPTYAHLDARWREYVRSRLWDKRSQQLTREFREALTETFLRFCTGHTIEGVLGKAQFNALQVATGGEAITDEGFEYFFSYGTKTLTYTPRAEPHPGLSVFFGEHAHHTAAPAQENVEPVEVIGLPLEAFLTMYTNQALQLPLTTLEELTNLGFDLHLNRTTFGSLEEAENAVIGNTSLTPKSDLELVRYAEQLISEMDGGSALQMNVSHIKSITMESHLAQLYPRLVKLSMPLICLRYEMLRQFNQKVSEVFPLVNMGSHGELSTWLSDCRGLIFHGLKMNFVYRVLERTADGTVACPSIILNRIDISANKDLVMATRTEDLFTKKTAFGQAFTQLQNTDPMAFRRPKPNGAEPHFAMRVLFQKENVQGDGGPYRQFFTDIAKELAEVLPLLVPCPNAQTKIGNNRDKFVVTPSSNSNTYLKMYRFIGQLMGMAMRTGVMLAIDLPSFFWKPLVGIAPTSQDIRDIDHSFHTVLKYLKNCSPDVFQGETRTIFDHFLTTLSDKSKMLLKPGGDTLEVTYDNRLEYCRLAEIARINESYMQLVEVRRGLADFVPLSMLNMFTWQDLQWRVCGRPQIDLKLLKRHTEYADGVSPTSPHIRYFWQVLRSFSQEDRRAFVRFAWAQERLPADDQEFARSQTRMMIKPGPVSDQVFPTADTCFFNLSLPVYSSPDVLRERLLFAIHTDGAMDNDRPNHNDNGDI